MKSLSLFLCSFSLIHAALAAPPREPDASPPPTLTLGEVTRAVLQQNRSIREARAKWDAAKQRVPQAAAWDDLRVGAETRVARFVDVASNSFTDQMLSVEQMLPLSGKNRSRARIAAAEALGAFEELRRRELDQVAKARASYFKLARGYTLLELNRANATSLQQSLDLVRAKLEVAGQSQTDVLAAETELLRIEESARDLERGLGEEQAQLALLMGRDAFRELPHPPPDTLSITPPPPETGRLRALLLANRPEIRMAQAVLVAAKAKMELAKREWIPDPTISVQAQRYNAASQGVSEVAAGVSFSLPWLNGRKYRAEENEAAASLSAAEQALEQARLEGLAALRAQLQKIETLHHHTELFATRLIPTARQAVQTNRTGYESGKTSFLEVIAAERALRETEAMHTEHLADYRATLAELDALVGRDGTTSPQKKGGAK